MNQVIPFTFESTKVRMFEESGKVFFCGKDVATALGYVNTKDALAKHCKGVAKTLPPSDGRGIQQIRFITEAIVPANRVLEATKRASLRSKSIRRSTTHDP